MSNTQTAAPTREALEGMTVKDLKAVAALYAVQVPAKARKDALIAAIDADPYVRDQRAEETPAEAPAEVEVEVEETDEDRTPFDAYLRPTLVEHLEAIAESAVVIGGQQARRNRDALASMNLPALDGDKVDVAVHRVPNAVLLIALRNGFDPKPHGDVTAKRQSLHVQTDDPEALRILADALMVAAREAHAAAGDRWEHDTQQILLYSGRAYVHANHLENRLQRAEDARVLPVV